jgi:hypothetical protein
MEGMLLALAIQLVIKLLGQLEKNMFPLQMDGRFFSFPFFVSSV